MSLVIFCFLMWHFDFIYCMHACDRTRVQMREMHYMQQRVNGPRNMFSILELGSQTAKRT